jgi:hypothetical protein
MLAVSCDAVAFLCLELWLLPNRTLSAELLYRNSCYALQRSDHCSSHGSLNTLAISSITCMVELVWHNVSNDVYMHCEAMQRLKHASSVLCSVLW